MKRINKPVISVILVILVSFQCVCAYALEKGASEPKSPYFSREFNGKDRLESFNRLMYGFNMTLNDYIIYPVNVAWTSIMPKYGIERISNIFDNLAFPKRLAGSLLQGDLKASGTESLRFLTNSTLGLAGMYDPADDWFNIKPRNEDIGQAFARWGIGSGYYLYLPFVGPTNVRNGIGSILETPLKPENYTPWWPVVISIKGARLLDTTTNLQDVLGTVNETYTDSYEITKLLYGVKNYYYNNNLDRREVFNRNNVETSPTVDTPKPDTVDIELAGFNSQGPIVDSLRSILFDRQPAEKSMWMDISLWNNTFKNRFKTDSVNFSKHTPDYEYRYILQEKGDSPLAIIYPSIGENIRSEQASAIAKILYENGYSVLIVSSVFDWKFVRSMPGDYRPGIAPIDAKYLRIATSEIIRKISKKYPHWFTERIVIGTSMGALHTLFVAAQEKEENLLGASRYISISPPVEMLYSLKKIDKFIENWKISDDRDIKLKSTLTAVKVMRTCGREHCCDDDFSLNFSEDEAKLAIGFNIKQKLSDVVLTIEENSGIDKSKLYEKIIRMNFQDYLNEYFLSDQESNIDKLNHESSLYVLTDFLRKSNNIKIFLAHDDYLLAPDQLKWLKNTAGDKVTVFGNGAHLGFLYRQEFKDEFMKETESSL